MILFIDTTDNEIVKIALKDKGEVIASKEFSARMRQAEKLLPAIDKMLKLKTIGLKNLEKIEVADQGGSFTSLRIGIITANALGYALGIPVTNIDGKAEKISENISIVKPKYDREPNITMKKARN